MRGCGVILVALLLVAGCGGGGDDRAAEPDCTPETTSVAGATTTTDPRCVEGATEAGRPASSNPGTDADVVWEGTVEGIATPTGTSAESGCERSSETGPVTLTARGAEVSGSMTASGSYTCMGITIPTSGTVGIEGQLRGDTIEFGVTSIEGLLLSVGNCMVGQELEIPLRDDTGRVTFTEVAPSGDTYECTIEIEQR